MSTIALKRCQHVLDVVDADLAESTFEEVALPHAVFSMVMADNITFTKVSMVGAAFRGIRLDGATFEDTHFTNVDVRGSTYEGMRIEGISVDELLAAWHARI